MPCCRTGIFFTFFPRVSLTVIGAVGTAMTRGCEVTGVISARLVGTTPDPAGDRAEGRTAPCVETGARLVGSIGSSRRGSASSRTGRPVTTDQANTRTGMMRGAVGTKHDRVIRDARRKSEPWRPGPTRLRRFSGRCRGPLDRASTDQRARWRSIVSSGVSKTISARANRCSKPGKKASPWTCRLTRVSKSSSHQGSVSA